MKRSRARTPSEVPDPLVRQKILVGAREHFFAHGFRAVTMGELAAEMGISKKTLYVHFLNKAALLEFVIEDKLGRIRGDVEGVMTATQLGFAQRLQSLLAGLRSHLAEIQPVFLRDVQRETPELFARIQQGRRKIIFRAFGQLLEEGRNEGVIRKDLPVSFLIEMLLATVDGVMTAPRLEELGMSPKAAFAHLVSVFLEGAYVRKGGSK